MNTSSSHAFIAACNAFVQQMVLHHEHGDYYPHAPRIAAELGFPPDQTAAVLGVLRAYGWIATGPYGPEETRITARGWDCLKHHRTIPERAARLDIQMIGKQVSEKVSASMNGLYASVAVSMKLDDECPEPGR